MPQCCAGTGKVCIHALLAGKNDKSRRSKPNQTKSRSLARFVKSEPCFFAPSRILRVQKETEDTVECSAFKMMMGLIIKTLDESRAKARRAKTKRVTWANQIAVFKDSKEVKRMIPKYCSTLFSLINT